jgi:hypothetical protein
MIPKHLSLVPVNSFQLAALKAIIEVEERRQRGQYPYAIALLKQLRGGPSGRISSADVHRAALNYNSKDRHGEPKERYLAALNILVESRGGVCPLPLSDSASEQYFPQTAYRVRERHLRRWDVASNRREAFKAKEHERKRRRYKALIAQAEIELAFVTPSQLATWYCRQSQFGLYDDDLVLKVQSWSKRFISMSYPVLYSGQPLWSIIDTLQALLANRSKLVEWLDALSLNNKLTTSTMS